MPNLVKVYKNKMAKKPQSSPQPAQETVQKKQQEEQVQEIVDEDQQQKGVEEPQQKAEEVHIVEELQDEVEVKPFEEETPQKLNIQPTLESAGETKKKSQQYEGLVIQTVDRVKPAEQPQAQSQEIIPVSEWNDKYPAKNTLSYSKSESYEEFMGTRTNYLDVKESDPVYKSYLIQYKDYMESEEKDQQEHDSIMSLRSRLEQA